MRCGKKANRLVRQPVPEVNKLSVVRDFETGGILI